MPILADVQYSSLGTLESILESNKSAVPYSASDVGTNVERVVLASPDGAIIVTVCSLGATIESIIVRDKGEMLYQPEDWLTNPRGYNGRSVGRLAGRTRNYTVLSKTSHGEEDEHVTSTLNESDMAEVLHGGRVGFSHRVWRLVNTFCSQLSARAVFELESEHMDQGHPGAIKIEAHVSAVFDGVSDPRCDIRYRAKLSEKSPSQALVNLTSHCYFSLGENRCLDLQMHLPSSISFFPKFLSTETTVCEGTDFDFRNAKLIEKPLDNYFTCSETPLEGDAVTLATISSHKTKVRMTITSTCPGVQVYTGQHCEHRGVCLELQYPPVVSDLPGFVSRVTLEGKAVALANLPARQLSSRMALTAGRRSSGALSSDYEYDELTMHAFGNLL